MALEFLEGNEAVARAAMHAKCDFFAGYPITPSSTILQYMLDMLPRAGGIAIQAEDEIASMGMCIGASMAGSKVLTATSGPGISLYSENVGLAIMGETPLVIVNVQRQGPATGSATKGAEGDVLFTRWATSGGLPVIVLSPATVAETYELTYRAFNLAERFRVPVFLLTNKEIGLTQESVDLDSIDLPPLVERRKADSGQAYLPHDFEKPSEVPAISDFGVELIARFTTSTHDKAAYLTASPAVIQEMIDHYTAKVEAAADDIAFVKDDLQERAEILILSYGVVSRSAAVAVREARGLTLQTLYPVPETAIRRTLRGMKKVIVPEMNMGQYSLEVERLVPDGTEVVGVNKMDTTLISPAEITERGGLL
jgi:2-oxoglutarate ferredoxin oxidoreductase subunit alpha